MSTQKQNLERRNRQKTHEELMLEEAIHKANMRRAKMNPGRCPACNSDNVFIEGHQHYCCEQDCGETW